MAPLAALTAKHNAACDEKKAQEQRDDVAETREERGGVRGRRQDCVDYSRFAPEKRVQHVAAGIDDGADASRRCAKDRQTLLGRAEPRLSKVLRRAPGAEPRIV